MSSKTKDKFFGKFTKEYKPDDMINLAKEFDEDPRQHKINMSIGIIYDENEEVYIPSSVQKASENVARIHKGYLLPKPPLGWSGEPAFIEGIARLIFGEYAKQLLDDNLLAAIATAGGTQAVAVFADAIKITSEDAKKNPPTIVLGKPLYINHPVIFADRGLPIKYYPQLDNEGAFNMQGLIKKINNSEPGTIFLFHGAAHNPTGINIKSDMDWKQVAQLLHKRKLIAFFDIPYAGLDKGVTEDIEPVRIFMREGVSLAVAFSLSKTAGLYGERVGVLYIPCKTTQYALSTTGLFNAIVRRNNTSPPGNGQRIMSELLTNSTLRYEWLNTDMPQIAKVIQQRREILADQLPKDLADSVRFGKGIFTILPITIKGVEYLKKKHAIYVVSSDENRTRINFGGATIEQTKHAAPAIRQAYSKYQSPTYSSY